MAKNDTMEAKAVYEIVIGGVTVEPKQTFTAETKLVESLIKDGVAVLPDEEAQPVHVDATVNLEAATEAP